MAHQTVNYNGYVFQRPRLRVQEEPVYDEPRITQVGIRYHFTVTGVVAAATPALLAAELLCMRGRLNVPHKEFFVEWDEGGGRFFSFDGTANAEWGPTPTGLDIEQFAGGRAATYSWNLDVVSKQCFDGCTLQQRTEAVFSNTRSWDHAVDENGFTTRTVTGRLIVDAAAVQNGRPADVFRHRCVPNLPINFERRQQTFRQSPDGRVLDYHVVDVERMWTLPRPITSGRADFSIRIADMGAIVDYSLDGQFAATAAVSKAVILQRIFDLIAVKFPIAKPGFFFEECEFREAVYDNNVSFHVRAKSGTGQATGAVPDFGLALQPLGVAPASTTPGQAESPSPYGHDGTVTSGIRAVAPKAYDACVTGTVDSGYTFDGGTITYDGDGGVPEGTPTGVESTGISESHDAAPFESLRETVSYEVDNKLVRFAPKVAGAKPIIQQTATPTLTAIQVGYYRQYAKDPAQLRPVPPPVFGVGGVVQYASIEPSAPTPVGNGTWNLYTVHWRYVVLLTQVMAEEAFEATKYPVDPRRSDDSGPDAGDALPGTPNLVVIPGVTALPDPAAAP